MTTPTLRVLVLDDNPHDRQLTLREMRKEFPDVEAIEPLDDGEFREALEWRHEIGRAADGSGGTLLSGARSPSPFRPLP